MPPLYTVDLSLHPRQRHAHICNDFKHHIKDLVPIYWQLLNGTRIPRFLDILARRLLRRVYSNEEQEEIMGIVEATGMPKHLVIAYNTFLDLLSGCSSGGVRVKDAGDGKQTGIVHFRGLDWEMEPLRKIIIRVEYVRDGNVVARCVHATSQKPPTNTPSEASHTQATSVSSQA
jgi:hypothetical protein